MKKHLSLENLGRKVADRRGNRGIRVVAKDIGISPSTLSRIENGHLPDLETFKKICDWLDVNPGDVLGSKAVRGETHRTTAHFKKDKTIKPETANALAKMILSAQRALELQEGR